jgi:membrane protease YdiL (CAAX protease family)
MGPQTTQGTVRLSTSVLRFARQHPVMTYFALTFSISWGGLLLVIGPSGIRGIMEQTTRNSLFWSLYVVTVAGPSAAGILSSIFVYGKRGLRNIVAGLLRWRVGARWYAVALLVAPLSVFPTLFVLSVFSPAFIPGILTAGDQVSLVLFAVAVGLVNPWIEELGWTGFAVPELGKRYGILANGLIVGIMWGAWHFLSNLWGASSVTIPLALFMPAMLFSFLPPFRVLMVWVYDRTRSLLVAVIMHGSLNAFWLIATPTAITAANLVTWYIAWAAVLWVISGIVVLRRKT